MLEVRMIVSLASSSHIDGSNKLSISLKTQYLMARHRWSCFYYTDYNIDLNNFKYNASICFSIEHALSFPSGWTPQVRRWWRKHPDTIIRAPFTKQIIFSPPEQIMLTLYLILKLACTYNETLLFKQYARGTLLHTTFPQHDTQSQRRMNSAVMKRW